MSISGLGTGLAQERLISNLLGLAIQQKFRKYWIFNRRVYYLNEGTSWVTITIGRKIIT